jgi:Alginate export
MRDDPRTRARRSLAAPIAGAAAIAIAASPAPAAAQASVLSDSIVVGAWTFHPTLEVRVRGEYLRHPFDVGGDTYASTAVLAEAYKSTLPAISYRAPQVNDEYFVTERIQLGLAVDRGPVTAAVTLQDAREAGAGTDTLILAPAQLPLQSFEPSEGYVDVHTRSGHKVFMRVGRQKVTWGDGRLLGANDWSKTGRSLDAGRFGFQAGDFDVQLLAALVAMPGTFATAPALPSETSTTPALPTATGTGTQLYGLDAVWHALPLLGVEALGLARVVRDPVPTTLTPGDTYVIDGRLFGDYRGFRYALDGAYELGRVAGYGVNRDLRAFAFAGRASWETALPGHLTFGAEGAYASGDKGSSTGDETRFDPILPDEHTHLGPMGLFAWSNVILVGGSIGVRPIEELGFLVGYRYAALAQPSGRWTDAQLTPIGAAPASTARSLGNEVDVAIKIKPWHPLDIETGYGLFARGAGADAILIASGKPATLQHWAYLQTTVRVP